MGNVGQEHLRQEIDRVEHQIEAAITTLHLLTNGEDSLTATAGIEDVKDCSSHGVALKKSRVSTAKRMRVRQHACLSKANASAAARLLIQAGLSKSKPRNLTSSLYNHMHKSDEWEWVSPGTFELVHFIGWPGQKSATTLSIFPADVKVTPFDINNA